MKLKEVRAEIVRDSRGEKTILVRVNGQVTSAPSGKSTGKYEKKCYRHGIEHDVSSINNMDFNREINKFEDLIFLEKYVKKNIGANTLFALEASVLKALAAEKNLELYEYLNPKLKKEKGKGGIKFPRIISNTIGGGAHTNVEGKKPEFQEFLITCNKNPYQAKEINNKAYYETSKIIETLTGKQALKNDENALAASLGVEQAFEIIKDVQENIFDETKTHLDVGVDVAASQFFDGKNYIYKSSGRKLSRQEQIDYIVELSEKYNLFYIEDPLEEEDFLGFSELVRKCNCLIVGDDLTVTNLERVKEAIKKKAINAMIIKPNQIGSLLEVREVIELCKKNKISTIISHRSGETLDNSIADLGVAFECDFIKIPVIGRERLAKVNRLEEIEKIF